jgi:predicted TIM-barrel fold metal-dependent hydrolase
MTMKNDRRQFLTGLATFGAGALLPSGLAAQGRGQGGGRGGRGAAPPNEVVPPEIKNTRKIDVHNHYAPPTWQAAMDKAGLGNVRGSWTPAKLIEEMDRGGTQTAMISTGQFIWRLGTEARQKLLIEGARDANEYGAKMVADYPGRFGLWASLPLPNIDRTLKEIAYSLDTLKAAGFGITTSWGRKYLGDPMFIPVLEELNRRRAIVYSHPGEPECCLNLIPGLPPNPIEYGTDTTRQIMSLIVNKVPWKYPNIRFLVSHAGGTAPFLIGRFDGVNSHKLDQPAPPDSVLWGLRTFYYDTAAAFNPAAMYATKKVMGADRILFGTDYPYGDTVEVAKGVIDSGIFTDAELKMIWRDNAAKLLPQFART